MKQRYGPIFGFCLLAGEVIQGLLFFIFISLISLEIAFSLFDQNF